MSAEPMTTESLDAVRVRVAAYDGPDHYAFTIEGIEYDGHWAHDTGRLLAEVDRLREWQANATRLLTSSGDASTTFMRERDEARADCVELSAEKERLERKLTMAQRARKAGIRMRQDLERKLIGWREAAEKATAERDALAAKVDRLQSERNALVSKLGLDWGPDEFGDLDAASGMPRPPAEEARSRPEPVRGSTAKGIGVSEPDRRSEAAHWLKFDKTRRVTGCRCGFAADVDSDCGWGDSVVAHLLEVAAAATRPAHINEAAASLRSMAAVSRAEVGQNVTISHEFLDGIDYAAECLDSVAKDFEDDTAAALDRAHNHGQRST